MNIKNFFKLIVTIFTKKIGSELKLHKHIFPKSHFIAAIPRHTGGHNQLDTLRAKCDARRSAAQTVSQRIECLRGTHFEYAADQSKKKDKLFL